ncbi:hypothetical protein RchiOBHm_Chr4g0416931 [Rosa chinensis]|uniref:Uncharacterized protein n=1 Tax=Rosa chinensis TaxID=74649 RepID=A0A2P6QWY7_ROSCH|nr:hypothetical protein RchiOBHm_Chr4g0416931 [Rosa chinensis]
MDTKQELEELPDLSILFATIMELEFRILSHVLLTCMNTCIELKSIIVIVPTKVT